MLRRRPELSDLFRRENLNRFPGRRPPSTRFGTVELSGSSLVAEGEEIASAARFRSIAAWIAFAVLAGAQAAQPEDSNEMDRSNGLTLNSSDRTSRVIRKLQPTPTISPALASVSPYRTNMNRKAASC